jgi:hypothetical protein
MPELAYSALTAVIFTSALGALVMCLLVFKYGFTPDPDELPTAAVRRVFITRLGHAVAGTCFAAAAILAAVTLVDLTSVAPPAGPSHDRLVTDERLATLTTRVSAAEARLQRADERVRRVEADLQKVGDDLVSASPSRDTARPRVVAPPPSVSPSPPIVAPPPSASMSPPPSKPDGPAVRADPPRPPVVVEPRAAAPAPKPTEPVARTEAPQPSSFGGSRVATPVPKLAKPAQPKTPPADDLASRLRRDWEAVKRGFATAGSDFRSAVDEQGRSLRGALD